MKFPGRIRLLRPFKFAPFTLISIFLFTNLTGVLFSRALAPADGRSQAILTSIPGDIPTSGNAEIDRMIFRAGIKEGVDPRFIHAVIWRESKYETEVRSHAGAQGIMQLMPATARRFGCDDPGNTEENIGAGTKYLSWLLKRFSGNVELALAGYNAGEGAVDKYDGIPPYTETQNYVREISERYGKSYHPVLPPEQAMLAFHLK
jgi:soluble lytic murein transglycosylase-like protein